MILIDFVPYKSPFHKEYVKEDKFITKSSMKEIEVKTKYSSESQPDSQLDYLSVIKLMSQQPPIQSSSKYYKWNILSLA